MKTGRRTGLKPSKVSGDVLLLGGKLRAPLPAPEGHHTLTTLRESPEATQMTSSLRPTKAKTRQPFVLDQSWDPGSGLGAAG